MYSLSRMSLWEKVKLLIRITLLKERFLKYQTVENYRPGEENLDTGINIVFFWQPSSVFYWNGNPQKEYKSYAAYKADQEKPFVWETASYVEREADIRKNHSWPNMDAPIISSGIESVVLAGGESGFFNSPPITRSGEYSPTVYISLAAKDRLLDWVNSKEGKQKLNSEAIRQHGVVLKGYPLED